MASLLKLSLQGIGFELLPRWFSLRHSGSGAVEAEKTIVGPLKHFNVFLVLFGGFPCKALNVKLCLYK
ncbi:hypothetical protein GQ55_9G539400 [Panicum hallii var. hallii]|uniref:Uncharacterized protein n=1 Tax=Panicum hallii var. hallii TaxID=1504633 RepID=A0A2T7CEU8_9POAL|nr:hypothetical protein GQ55_9G539400 [Panicum hallii var. hallii]